MTTAFWIVTYAALVNLAAFAAFGWDKRQARRDNQRVSESALLNLAFFGGSIGAKFAQAKFRHKTRKQPFARRLNLIAALHVAFICGAAVWTVFDLGQP